MIKKLKKQMYAHADIQPIACLNSSPRVNKDKLIKKKEKLEQMLLS